MKYIICTEAQKEDVEKKVFARLLKQKLTLNGFSTVYNVVTKQEEDFTKIIESSLTSDKYPILGWKNDKVNKINGYTTTYFCWTLLDNGNYTCAFPENIKEIVCDYQEDTIEKTEILNDTSVLLDGLVYEEWTDIKPKISESINVK